MKFPKSLHADGWSNHIDATPSERSIESRKLDINAPLAQPQPRMAASAPLHAAKAPASGVRMTSTQVPPPIVTRPAIDPQPTSRAAALPPQRNDKTSWMVAAGAGAAVIAAIAVWAVNRPADVPHTPPALVTGSVQPQAEVAAATPAPEAASAAEDAAPTTTASADNTDTAMAAEEAARPAPALTTVKPAAEPRPVAQAAVPAPRPDLVVRANPRTPEPQPERTPYLQPSTTVAAAPSPAEMQPLAVTPGTAPIDLPPTAAGPVATPNVQPEPAAVTAQAAPTAPVSPTADPAVTSTSPGTPPLAQAPLPAAEDSGITVKVRSALASDSTLAAVPISVSTDHGVVKLEGQAPDAPTRERATVVAASTSGVKGVDNRLTLPPATVVSQAPVN